MYKKYKINIMSYIYTNFFFWNELWNFHLLFKYINNSYIWFKILVDIIKFPYLFKNMPYLVIEQRENTHLTNECFLYIRRV